MSSSNNKMVLKKILNFLEECVLEERRKERGSNKYKKKENFNCL